MVDKCPFLSRGADESRERMPLTAELRSQTQPLHDEAERAPLHGMLFGSQGQGVAREAYERLLMQHLHIQETYEPLLRSAARENRALSAAGGEERYHLGALRADIEFLKIGSERRTVGAASREFAASIQMRAEQSPLALLGVAYVFEGSTNGGTIIAKRIRELQGFDTEKGTEFINPHGTAVRMRWAAWKAAADALGLTGDERSTIVHAALEAFRGTLGVLQEVHQCMQRR